MSTESRVEKLNNQNYTTWSLVLSSLLKSKGLWDYVEKEHEKTAETAVKNEEAKALMYTTMESAQIMATGFSSSAFELWSKIKENHEGAQKDLQNNSLAVFLGFKYNKGETLVQYCGRFETALGKLVSTGYKVDESTKIWVFRHTVPKEIGGTITTWVMSNPNGKCSELISQLKMNFHLEKGMTNENHQVALYTGGKINVQSTTGQAYRSNSVGKGRVGNNSANNPNASRERNDNGNSKWCAYCKTSGHLWKECNKKKADDQRKKSYATGQNNRPNSFNQRGSSSQSNRQRSSGGHTALAAGKLPNGETTSTLNSIKGNSKNLWVVDSGATAHMTPHKSWLLDFIEYDEVEEVELGDGRMVKALGEGTLHWRSGVHEGVLLNVMYAPDMIVNLLSVTTCCRNGFEVVLSHEEGVRFLLDGQPKLVGRKKGRLFIVELIPTKLEELRNQVALLGASLDDWHKRFAHASKDAVKDLIKNDAVDGLKIDNSLRKRCEECAMGKICRCPHPSRFKEVSSGCAVLHMDTVGPVDVDSLGGSKYYVLATEEYTGYRLISFVTFKSEIPDSVKQLITKFEVESHREIKMIVTDNGTEYVNNSLRNWLNSRGTVHDLSAAYTPEQNGLSERANRTVIEGVRTLLQDSKLPHCLWAEAANTVVYTLNRTLAPKSKDKTRYELYFGHKPNVGNLRQFGQPAIIHVPKRNRDSKWSPSGCSVVFVGYTGRYNTYRFFDPSSNTVIVSCNAVFLDTPLAGEPSATQADEPKAQEVLVSLDKPAKTNSANSVEPMGNSDNLDSTVTSDPNNSLDSSATETYGIDDTIDESLLNSSTSSIERPVTRKVLKEAGGALFKDVSLPRWFWGNSRPTDREEHSSELAMAAFTLSDEPMDYKDAMSRPDREQWQEAMNEELRALAKNNTWELVPRPDGIKPIRCKWVFKLKYGPDGSIDRYKARLVAKGYSQIPNVDYKETFAPTASMNTIRLIFGIANQYNMDILQFDVKTAFLYGDLDEVLYMDYPEGYPNPQKKVCKLTKSLYGLKQAPRQWNIKFDNFLKKFHLNQSRVDKCLYYNDDRTLFLVIYVDDGLVATTDCKLLKSLVSYLKNIFELKTMECEAYLGFRVKRDRESKSLYLLQNHYVDKVLEKFNMLDCKPASTPEEVGAVATTDAEPLTEEYPFRELVGSLLYLVTCTRPDIAHAVSVASRTSKPTTAHWQMLKRILRYLKGTKDIGIHFRWEKSPRLVGFSDADYANDVETRRSTTGYCIFYGSAPIAWKCQRQAIVSLSTTEAEYIAGCDLVKELLPIQEIMREMNQGDDEPTPVLIDNQSTVKIAQESGGQQRTKHIDVRDKWLSEQHAQGKIKVQHISGDKQAADILTKPLHKTKFASNRSLLLSSLMIIACLFTMTAARKFERAPPLDFKLTDRPYFAGDTEYDLELVFSNPCQFLFQGLHPLNESHIDNKLMKQCNDDFDKYLVKAIPQCSLYNPLPDNDAKLVEGKLVNETVTVQNHAEVHNQMESKMHKLNNGKELIRNKRFIPLIYIAGYLILTGATGVALLVARQNAQNVEILAQLRDKERALLDDGANVMKMMRDAFYDIQSWSIEIDKKLKAAEVGDRSGMAAGLIDYYTGLFKEHNHVLKELDKSMTRLKVTPLLRTLSNDSLWEEPAAEWSTLLGCRSREKDRNLHVNLNFVVPTRNTSIQVQEAIHFDFYNISTNGAGRTELCWMKYNGPKLVLYNTTNNCMTEILDSATEEGSVRFQQCISKEDELKDIENLWSKEDCKIPPKQPEPIKRRVQDKGIHGYRRIYCYPYNITIGKDIRPCPDYAFDLESKTQYNVANLEHYGAYVVNVKSLDYDPKVKDKIINRLKADKIKVRALNFTGIGAAVEYYTHKLSEIPKKAELITSDLGKFLESPIKFLSEAFDTVWEYIATAGYVVAGLALVFVLAMLAPFIQVFIILFKAAHLLFKAWVRSITDLAAKLSFKFNYQRQEMPWWEKEKDYKRLV